MQTVEDTVLDRLARALTQRAKLESIVNLPWKEQAAAMRLAIFEGLDTAQQYEIIRKFGANVWQSDHAQHFISGEPLWAKHLPYINDAIEHFDTEDDALLDAFLSIQEDFACGLTFALNEALGGGAK